MWRSRTWTILEGWTPRPSPWPWVAVPRAVQLSGTKRPMLDCCPHKVAARPHTGMAQVPINALATVAWPSAGRAGSSSARTLAAEVDVRSRSPTLGKCTNPQQPGDAETGPPRNRIEPLCGGTALSLTS